MAATLTDLARKTKDVVRPVQSGKEVVLTERGKPFAKIVPFRSFDRKAALRILREMGPVKLPSRK
jgi:prevent-host-death family protein